MNCDRDTLMLLSAYADGETNNEETKKIVSHLAVCSECRDLLEELQGQKQVMQWAFSQSLPEDTYLAYFVQPVQETTKMNVKTADTKTPAKRTMKVSWRYAIAAVLLVFAIQIVWYNVKYPFLKVGETVSAKSTGENARLGGGTVLEIGPNTRIIRLSEKSIRLDQGWINASVKGKSGIQIISKRFEVTDQGTEFTVGTTSKFDYAAVKEGSVIVKDGTRRDKVNSGWMAVKEDNSKPYVTALPNINEPDTYNNIVRAEEFCPANARDIEQNEAKKRLADRFPDIKTAGGSGGTNSTDAGLSFGANVSGVVGFNKGIRDHLTEIMQATAGERVDGGEWEIPAAVVCISDDATNPKLPKDAYLVSLASRNGALVWKFAGSLGTEADVPLDFKRGFWPDSNSLSFNIINVSHSGGGFTAEIMAHIWPGKTKAVINIAANITQKSSEYIEASRRLSVVRKEMPIVDSFGTTANDAIPLCLDTDKKNRFVILWNRNAEDDISSLWNSSKHGKGGSVLLGVLASDVPLIEPAAPKGLYLLKLVVPNGNGKPDIELVAQNNTTSWYLQEKEIYKATGGANCSTFTSKENFSLSYSTCPSDGNGFQFSFSLRPQTSSKDWAIGYLMVKKR